jgi:hypothetical protein
MVQVSFLGFTAILGKATMKTHALPGQTLHALIPHQVYPLPILRPFHGASPGYCQGVYRVDHTGYTDKHNPWNKRPLDNDNGAPLFCISAALSIGSNQQEYS